MSWPNYEAYSYDELYEELRASQQYVRENKGTFYRQSEDRRHHGEVMNNHYNAIREIREELDRRRELKEQRRVEREAAREAREERRLQREAARTSRVTPPSHDD